jgi:hypothetical protein
LLSASAYRTSKEKNRMGRKHSTYGAEHKYINGFLEETRRKVEDPSTDDRTVFKQILEKQHERVWLGIIWLKIRTYNKTRGIS